jgi:hypothetical protein
MTQEGRIEAVLLELHSLIRNAMEIKSTLEDPTRFDTNIKIEGSFKYAKKVSTKILTEIRDLLIDYKNELSGYSDLNRE